MSKLLYYLFLLPLSKLPIQLLYVFSNGLYIVLYKVIGYRTKVVFGNLERSFPEKSPKEIKAIASDFYRHFCDMIFESIHLFSTSTEEWQKRISVTNPEFIDAYCKENRPIVVFIPHYGNWETMATGFPMFTKMKAAALYSPLKDQFFNKILNDSRSKSGIILFPKKEVNEFFQTHINKPIAICFGGDQSPTSSKNSFWMDFLNQDTAMAFGTEKYAIQYNCPVLFSDIRKTGRGKHTMTFSLVTNNPQEEEHGFITRTNMQLLEKTIREEPRYWLWTHRRWKRTREK